jgi:hypothetical protein
MATVITVCPIESEAKARNNENMVSTTRIQYSNGHVIGSAEHYVATDSSYPEFVWLIRRYGVFTMSAVTGDEKTEKYKGQTYFGIREYAELSSLPSGEKTNYMLSAKITREEYFSLVLEDISVNRYFGADDVQWSSLIYIAQPYISQFTGLRMLDREYLEREKLYRNSNNTWWGFRPNMFTLMENDGVSSEEY